MRRALITVFFIGCIGSIAFQVSAGLREKTTHNISNLPSQIEPNRINVSTLSQTKENSRPVKKSNDATVVSVPSEGRGRIMMVAVFVLMGAIALRRILSTKA